MSELGHSICAAAARSTALSSWRSPRHRCGWRQSQNCPRAHAGISERRDPGHGDLLAFHAPAQRRHRCVVLALLPLSFNSYTPGRCSS
eukprot:6207904-Pleurochrysis_carterae.AAC.2